MLVTNTKSCIVGGIARYAVTEDILGAEVTQGAYDHSPEDTAVYIGTKAEEKYYTQVCEHYRGTDVKVYRMQMQTDCYELKAAQMQ